MGRSVEITVKQWKLYENVPPNEKSKWIFSTKSRYLLWTGLPGHA
jgi:hypothetical protein